MNKKIFYYFFSFLLLLNMYIFPIHSVQAETLTTSITSVESITGNSAIVKYLAYYSENYNDVWELNHLKFVIKVIPLDMPSAIPFEVPVSSGCNNSSSPCSVNIQLPYAGTNYLFQLVGNYIFYSFNRPYSQSDGSQTSTSHSIIYGSAYARTTGTQPSIGGSGSSSIDYTNIFNSIVTKLDTSNTTLSTKLDTLNTTFSTYLNDINSNLESMGETWEDIKDILNEKLGKAPEVIQIIASNGVTTTDNSFTVTLDYENATQYQVKLNQGSWQTWTPISSSITFSNVTFTGMNIGYIRLKNASGKTDTGRIIFYKQ